MAWIYVVSRLRLDYENGAYLIKGWIGELVRISPSWFKLIIHNGFFHFNGFCVQSANDTLKIIACKKQHKKLAALEMELAAAQQEDFASKNLLENKGTPPKKRLLAVVGIITKFSHKNNRDAICKGMDANW
ncbi:unnamed protein product, partial [Vitis vinifera]|uniref:Uncharacterized protein n=1 Tax=Vitis vinifera TaxID=29760 RepID=D7TAT7_VITVI